MEHRTRKSLAYYFEGILFTVECFLASRRKAEPGDVSAPPVSEPEFVARIRRIEEMVERRRRARGL